MYKNIHDIFPLELVTHYFLRQILAMKDSIIH